MNLIGQKVLLDGQVIDTLSNQRFKLPEAKVYAWSFHKQVIVALGIANTVQLWTERKPNDWQQAIAFSSHQYPIIHISWAPYDVTFASIDQTGLALIHSKKQDTWDQPIPLNQEKYSVIAFAQNKSTIAAGGNCLDFYENFKLVHRVNLPVQQLAYSFTDRLLAVSDNSISIFERNILKQHILLEQIPTSVSWSLSGSKIYVQVLNETFQYVENLYNEFVLQD
ncbi:unnamed protein product [Paramecium octaurelia]|uniref:Uncharacterized protein n=1 Tax=Paramecium octaurelia TaxID=43137 RepID=A0A8S1SIF7_PAROT|nr:unnamed protein product [Paramecium octaurelia]